MKIGNAKYSISTFPYELSPICTKLQQIYISEVLILQFANYLRIHINVYFSIAE